MLDQVMYVAGCGHALMVPEIVWQLLLRAFLLTHRPDKLACRLIERRRALRLLLHLRRRQGLASRFVRRAHLREVYIVR